MQQQRAAAGRGQRLTRAELEGRRERANEAIERFRVLHLQYHTERARAGYERYKVG